MIVDTRHLIAEIAKGQIRAVSNDLHRLVSEAVNLV